MQETWAQSLGQEDTLEEEMATHSSILAWRIPWTEEPGGLQLMGLQKSQTRLSKGALPLHQTQGVNEISTQGDVRGLAHPHG